MTGTWALCRQYLYCTYQGSVWLVRQRRELTPPPLSSRLVVEADQVLCCVIFVTKVQTVTEEGNANTQQQHWGLAQQLPPVVHISRQTSYFHQGCCMQRKTCAWTGQCSYLLCRSESSISIDSWRWLCLAGSSLPLVRLLLNCRRFAPHVSQPTLAALLLPCNIIGPHKMRTNERVWALEHVCYFIIVSIYICC